LADQYLAAIARVQRDLASLHAEASQALEVVKSKYRPGIQVLEERPVDLEQDLQAHLRQSRAIILFDAQDRVPMPHSLLIHTIVTVVHKARGVLAKLKDLGRLDASQVVEIVDWDTLEKSSDETLAAAGTKRKPVETFGYEWKGT
jgi:hypothetical protein